MLAFLPGDCYTETEERQEPNFYCTELVREAFGMHYPDKRRNKSLLGVCIQKRDISLGVLG
jgi:hypothetical protein